VSSETLEIGFTTKKTTIQTNQVHAVSPCLYNNHSNVILTPKPRSSKWTRPDRLSEQNCVRISPPPTRCAHFILTNSATIILSRVSVTKTRVWIGESVYWIFTSRNYNQLLHSRGYCNCSTRNVTLSLLILLLATLLFPWNFGTQVKSVPKSKSHCD
jgi:hypothetical protein